MRFLTLAALLAVPSLAMAGPRQFDLDCSGTVSNIRNGVTVSVKPFLNYHFRFDLDSQSYCNMKCESVERIQSEDSNDIVLKQGITAGTSFDMKVSRRTPTWFSRIVFPNGSIIQHETTCLIQPFSGFPAAKF